VKTQVTFTGLLTAARAMQPYTIPPRRRSGHRLLHLHTTGDTLTLAATTGEDTASVQLPAEGCPGSCALPPTTLIKALTATRLAGKAAAAATVTLHADTGRLRLAVNGGGPTISLDTTTTAVPATAPAEPQPGQQPVTTGPVTDWCDLVAGVATAAGTDPTRPDLAVVRLLREHPNVVLVAEATDRHRLHRGTWGDPHGAPVDVRIPTPAAMRAVRLLRAVDPGAQVRIHTDDGHAYWRTDRVQVAATTRSGPYPNLEKAREHAATDTAAFTVARDDLLATIDLIRRLNAVRDTRVRLTPHHNGVLDVALTTSSGAPIYQQSLTLQAVSGPVRALTFNPGYARDVVAFLDGPTITVHAGADRLAVYACGARRHGVVWQIAT
jgi:hypothetical protein